MKCPPEGLGNEESVLPKGTTAAASRFEPGDLTTESLWSYPLSHNSSSTPPPKKKKKKKKTQPWLKFLLGVKKTFFYFSFLITFYYIHNQILVVHSRVYNFMGLIM